MAIPLPFQKLKHGVLLCKANFKTFVETFNFLVDFAQNVRGDGDGNGNGIITFDRTVPDMPVIRSKVNLAWMNALEDKEDVGRFCISSKTVSGQSATIAFGNRYYRAGGKTYEVGSSSATVSPSRIVAVKIDITGSAPSATYDTYADLNAMKAAEADTNYYILPLYQFDANYNVVCDFRIGPDACMWEFGSGS